MRPVRYEPVVVVFVITAEVPVVVPADERYDARLVEEQAAKQLEHKLKEAEERGVVAFTNWEATEIKP